MKTTRCLRLLFLLVGLSIFIIGCSKKDESPVSINLNTSELSFYPEGGSQSITVSCNGDWSISGEVSWSEVSTQSGNGNSTVIITVSPNSSSEDRVATLIFTCKDEAAKLDILQSGASQSNYVDIDWNIHHVTNYDENSGTVAIQYTGDSPSFEENKAIVLPQEYGYDIRIIKSSSSSNNIVTLQTERGNMSNLFMNTSFTLSTDPSLSTSTKSGNSKIIAPTEIGIITESGYKIIYGRNSISAKSDYGASFDIFTFDKDFSGTDLYNSNGHRLFWEKCTFDIGLKGVFTFDFGKTIVNKIPVGDLKKFDFFLDGEINVDLLLKYIFSAQASDSKEKLLKENIIPTMVYRFMVGTVPVVILVYTHLYSRYDIKAEAEVTMSMGCNLQANAKLGLNYTKGVGVSPIMSFEPSFSLYDPTFTAKGSIAAKGSIYPKIEFGIYKFLGPWVEPMPYLREELEGGMRASTDGNNYLAWTLKGYSGLDCRLGLNLDFGMFDKEIWKSDIKNLKDVILFDAPKKIELISPDNGYEMEIGDKVEVKFKVSSYNNITKSYYPCIGGAVNVISAGKVDKTIAITDKDGMVTIQWTPQNKEDVLEVKIVNKDGETISEATFTPKIGVETGFFAGTVFNKTMWKIQAFNTTCNSNATVRYSEWHSTQGGGYYTYHTKPESNTYEDDFMEICWHFSNNDLYTYKKKIFEFKGDSIILEDGVTLKNGEPFMQNDTKITITATLVRNNIFQFKIREEEDRNYNSIHNSKYWVKSKYLSEETWTFEIISENKIKFIYNFEDSDNSSDYGSEYTGTITSKSTEKGTGYGTLITEMPDMPDEKFEPYHNNKTNMKKDKQNISSKSDLLREKLFKLISQH